MIRVLVADDSAFMRKVLSDLFSKQRDFEVAGTAANGREAVSKVRELKPDLLTLDVNMPVMDGLNALAIIMEENPMPVVMVSSLTQKGTAATIRALELGAVDFISKVGGSISKIDAIVPEILSKCRAAAQARVRVFGGGTAPQQARGAPVMKRIALPVRGGAGTAAPAPAPPAAGARGYGAVRQNPLKQPRENAILAAADKTRPTQTSVPGNPANKLVAIGTSTGGPQALQQVITKLPKNLPCGVVIVQHMPPGFTKSLAERLDSISAISVKEAEHGEIIRPGWVYIAPGNYHMRVAPEGSARKILLSQEPPVGNHRPAVNVLFDSVAQFRKDLVSVIMTGMGCDGCEGMKAIKRQGGYSIAQDEGTSVVYGMPKAVVDAGLADEVRPLQEIAGAIVAAVKR